MSRFLPTNIDIVGAVERYRERGYFGGFDWDDFCKKVYKGYIDNWHADDIKEVIGAVYDYVAKSSDTSCYNNWHPVVSHLRHTIGEW